MFLRENAMSSIIILFPDHFEDDSCKKDSCGFFFLNKIMSHPFCCICFVFSLQRVPPRLSNLVPLSRTMMLKWKPEENLFHFRWMEKASV